MDLIILRLIPPAITPLRVRLILFKHMSPKNLGMVGYMEILMLLHLYKEYSDARSLQS